MFCWNCLSGSREKVFFKLHKCILAILKSSPLGKKRGPSFKQTWIHSPKDAFYQVWLKLIQWFWRRRFLQCFFLHFFVIISPWKRVGPFIWTNVNPLHPRVLCVKFGWNWPIGSGEDFFYFANVVSLFRNYLPLEKGGNHHLNKPESHLPKVALCQIWMKLAQWFWRRRWKCEKFKTTTTTTTTTTDNRQRSLRLRWAKKHRFAYTLKQI